MFTYKSLFEPITYKKINLLVNRLAQTQPVEKNNRWLRQPLTERDFIWEKSNEKNGSHLERTAASHIIKLVVHRAPSLTPELSAYDMRFSVEKHTESSTLSVIMSRTHKPCRLINIQIFIRNR